MSVTAPRLYVVLDRTASAGRDLETILEGRARGRRRDDPASREDLALRHAVPAGAAAPGPLPCRVPFIVNDRVDLAVAVEADGVHLGQDDLPPAAARR